MFVKKMFIGAACALMLSACGFEKKDSVSKGEVTENNTINEQKKAESVVNTTDSPYKPFLSSDFKRYGLRGKVKQVVIYTLGCDDKGNLVGDTLFSEKVYFRGNNVYDSDNLKKFIRNDKGELNRVEMKVLDFEGVTVSTDYTYNDQGMLVQEDIHGLEWVGKRYYTYDNNLDCVSGVEKSFGEGSCFEIAKNYEIKERDAETNWTRRLVKVVNREGLDNGSGKWNTIETSYFMEVRDIIYEK